jgi:ribosomal protein S11
LWVKKDIMGDVFNKQINNYHKNYYLKLLFRFWLKRNSPIKNKKIEIPVYTDTAKIILPEWTLFNFYDSLFKDKWFFIKFYFFFEKYKYNYPTLILKGTLKNIMILSSRVIGSYFNKSLIEIYKKISNFYLFINKIIFANSILLVNKNLVKITYSKKQKKYIIIKLSKKIKKTHILLNITFKKRNTFFNVSQNFGKTIYLTSVRKEGYVGRKRTQYNSIFSVMRLVRKVIVNYFIVKDSTLSIIYKGWSRFRFAIKKSLNISGDSTVLPINYVKYSVKIPHNGCRAPKKRNRKKSKRFFKFIKKNY